MELDEVKADEPMMADYSMRRLDMSSPEVDRLPHSACIWPNAQSYDKSLNNDTSINELITARRFVGLQNAANRDRLWPAITTSNYSNNNNQCAFGLDDSILADPATADTMDGSQLRAKRIDMSFDLLDAASLVFSMISFSLDLVTDIAVAFFHYLNNDYWYCGLTAAFIMLPTLVTSGISLRWYIIDSRIEGSPVISKSQWATRFVFHILQIAPLLRYYDSLQYGMKFRRTQDPIERRKIYMKMIYEDADATMLRLFESFMESAPQLILQIYIITKGFPSTDFEQWTAILQCLSITSSLISISWSLVSYSKSLRISLPNKIPMSYSGAAVMFLWELSSVIARMSALALFTSVYVKEVGFVVLFHWLCMTGWIMTMQTNFCNSKCEELGFNALLGVIFIFCYFNPIDNATRYRYLCFYMFMFLENTALMTLWSFRANYEPWTKVLITRIHYSCFFLGIIMMIVVTQLIYYRFFHPTKGQAPMK